MIGTTLGKYRVTDRLGRGGMGVVYKAVDETLEREVAVKMLSSELAETDAVKRFKVEATTLARLNHPGIATIYELYRTDADVAMVMEFVRGETFDRLIERCGPLPPERAAYLCAQVLEALGHAHRAGIVHRDLKPSNLMLTEYGTVKIMDFGIARVLGSEHLTNDGYMMGTPAYMAPEQVLGQDIDGRADLYSVGVVLYRLITGHLPFTADTAIAMVQRQIKDPPTPVRVFRADVPDWCEQTLDRILAKSPADRFQTAEEFRAALLRGAGAAAAMNALVSVPDEIERTTPPDAMRVPTFTPALPVSAPTVGVATPPVAPPSSGSAAHVVPTEQPRSEKRRSAHTRGLAIAATAVVVVGAVAVTLLIGRPDSRRIRRRWRPRPQRQRRRVAAPQHRPQRMCRRLRRHLPRSSRSPHRRSAVVRRRQPPGAGEPFRRPRTSRRRSSRKPRRLRRGRRPSRHQALPRRCRQSPSRS